MYHTTILISYILKTNHFKTAVYSLLVFYSLFLFSCRKTFIENLQPAQIEVMQVNKDETEKFFNYPPTIEMAVIRVIDQMRRENIRSGFIANFLKNEGYAIWNNALVKEDPQSRSSGGNVSNNVTVNQVLIPLVYEGSNFVHAALACKVTGDSVYISLLDSRYYKQGHPSVNNSFKGRKLSLLLMMLDKEVFGHDLFSIKDSAVFESGRSNVKMVKLLNAKDSVTPGARTTANKLVSYSVSVCYTIFVPVNKGQLTGCPPDAPCPQYTEESKCDQYSGWYEDGSGGEGSTLIPSGGGVTSGGGGGGYTAPPPSSVQNPNLKASCKDSQ